MSAPAVAVSETGNKFAAAWKDVRSGEPNVYWAISGKPKLAAGQMVHDETRGKQDHPSLCIDVAGTVWVAWEDSRDGRQEIWIRSSREDDTGHRIGNPHGESASFPSIATAKEVVAVAYESHSENNESHSENNKTIRFHLISASH